MLRSFFNSGAVLLCNLGPRLCVLQRGEVFPQLLHAYGAKQQGGEQQAHEQHTHKGPKLSGGVCRFSPLRGGHGRRPGAIRPHYVWVGLGLSLSLGCCLSSRVFGRLPVPGYRAGTENEPKTPRMHRPTDAGGGGRKGYTTRYTRAPGGGHL